MRTLIALVFPMLMLAGGPFGFEKGMTKEQVIKLVGPTVVIKNADDKLNLKTAPHPHPAFEEYDLLFSPTQGLLKVVAIGVDVQTNPFGDRIQSAFLDIRNGIAQVYGHPSDLFDFVHSGSIWTDAQDWTMGLLKEERTLSTFWASKHAMSRIPSLTADKFLDLPNSLYLITLDANASSTSKGYVEVSYEFVGWGEYVESRTAKQNNVF